MNEIDLVFDLLRQEGPSGREGRVARFVEDQLLRAGAVPSWIQRDRAHRASGSGGETGNLILRLPGTMRKARRLLVAHMDTVPICVGARPRNTGKLIVNTAKGKGLGADNRAGCGVILNAALQILRRRLPHPPLTFLWTVAEEVGLLGARYVNLRALGRPRWGFNWDGGAAGKVTIGATGGYRMEIVIQGKASHAGSAPERGISAIAAASLAIADLTRRGWHGAIHHPSCQGTSNVGIIEGGSAVNVVADRVRVLAEARSHVPECRQQIIREMETAFENAAASVTDSEGQSARATIAGRLDYEAFCLSRDEPCVQLALNAAAAHVPEPELAVANGGLDASWLTARGVPTVTLGCGQRWQHTADEYLELTEYQTACAIALDIATDSITPNDR